MLKNENTGNFFPGPPSLETHPHEIPQPVKRKALAPAMTRRNDGSSLDSPACKRRALTLYLNIGHLLEHACPAWQIWRHASMGAHLTSGWNHNCGFCVDLRIAATMRRFKFSSGGTLDQQHLAQRQSHSSRKNSNALDVERVLRHVGSGLISWDCKNTFLHLSGTRDLEFASYVLTALLWF